MTQNRLKSKVAWLSVTAIIGFILGNYGLYSAIGLTDDTYRTLVDLVFVALSMFGVFNNPENVDGF